MPSRHISPQSFDEILSELGDDPAIPDPHGIRKPAAPRKPISHQPAAEKALFFNNLELASANKIWWFFGGVLAGTLLFLGLGTLFLDNLKADSQKSLEGTQAQVAELKKEIALQRQNSENIHDDLYQSIDELEVSIHSKIKSSAQTVKIITKVDPYEAEILRWRYLGMTQVGQSQQAFFQSKTARLAFQVGNSILGDWHLSEIKKDQASISNSKGKTLFLKAMKIE